MAFLIDNQKSLRDEKLILFVGHLGFFCYLIYCIVFYQERMLNNDAGFYSFWVINHEDYFVKHHRYISYFVQWLPILLAKLDFSLKASLSSYSYIFGIWYYLLFIYSAYILKNRWAGLYILLALVLCMRYKFYAGHTEITFAIAVASTLIVWITSRNKSQKALYSVITLLGTILLCAWLYIIHPVIVIPLLMVLGFDFFIHQKWKQGWSYIFILTVIITFTVRFLIVMNDDYESDKIALLGRLWEIAQNSKKYYVFIALRDYMFHYISYSFIALITTLGYFIYKKRYLEFLYFLQR